MIHDGINADLWDRLGRLDRTCHVVAMSRFVGRQRLGWWVRVTPRDGRAGERSISVEQLTLPEALSDAVAQAEALGWVSAA